jgi:rod shape-determining protein MreC
MAVSRHVSRRRYVLLLLVLTAVTLITLDSRAGRTGPLGAVGRGAHTVVSPIERGVNAVAQPVSDWWDGVTNAGHLKRENAALRRENAELRGKQAAAAHAINENKILDQLLHLPILSNVPRVAARVVNRDPGNFESTLTIDRGTESGIARDMPVMAGDGLVGKVIETWRGGSKVRVLVDQDSAVGVQTEQKPGHDSTTGIAEGRTGSRDVVVDDFDPQKPVVVGDAVVTSGLENSVFPYGLPVGKVVKVDKLPGGLGTRVRIRPYVDFDGVAYVLVLKWVPGQGAVISTTTTAPPTTTTTTVPGFGSAPTTTTPFASPPST